jgi:flagellar basal-body rod modification protein FlgD
MASAISSLTSLTGSSASASTASGSAGLGGSAPSEQVFLQLLVAQLQNQDPLSPQDSTEFVSELAQFSELEQTIGIRQDIESEMPGGANASSAASSAQPTTSTSSTNGQAPATNSISS